MMTDPARPTALRYGGAAVAVLLATAARLALHPALGSRQPFVTLYLTVIVTAWSGGLGPSLLALGLGVISGAYFLLAPPGPPVSQWVADVFGFALFLAVGAAIVAFGEAGRAARRRLEGEVTERRRAEEAGRAHGERLRATLHSIGDAVIVADAGGRVASLNPVAEALTGWGADEAAGRPLEEVFRIVHEETGLPAENPMQRALREGRAVDLADGTALVARDGTRRAIEDSAAPIRHDGAEPLGVVMVFRDVEGRRRAEAALRESEDHCRHAVELSPQLPWVAGPDGRMTDFSGRWLALTGLTREEALGDGWMRLPHPDDLPRMQEAWDRSVRSGEPYDLEHRTRLASGEYRWMRSRAFPRRDEAGAVVRWYGTTEDIAERKEAEEAIRRQAHLTGAITENATTAIFLMDAEGRTTFMNPAAEAMTGYAFREIEGRVLHDQVHHHRPDGSPLPMDECPIGQHVLAQRELRGHEDVFVRKDGTFFPVRCAARPIGGGGSLTGVVLEVQDIAEERRAEGRARFQAHLLDTVGQAVIATDPQGRVIYWNRAAEALYGWSAAEAEGRSILELVVAPEAAGRAAEIMDRMLAGEGWSGEFTVRRRDGTTFPAFVADTPVFGDRGELEAIIGVSSDITERKRAEERLRDSERRFARFMEYLPGLAWIKDAQGRYVYANDAAERAFRIPRDRLYGRTDEEVFPPETAAQFRAHDRRALAGGEGVQVVETLEHEDGAIHHSLVSKFPMPGPDGEAALVGGMAIDITDRMRAEEALRRGEERLRLIVESATDYAIFSLDLDGRVTTWNSGARNLLGYEEPEIVGRDGSVLFIPEDIERGVPEQEIRRALEQNRAENERWHVRKDGSLFWASGLLMPMRDGGEAVGLLKIMRDTTEQKRTEQELEVSRERLDLVVNSSEVGLWYCDLPFDRLVWNAKCKEHFGLPADAEVTIETFYERIHPEDREATRRSIEQSIEGRTEYDAEFRTVDPRGRARWVRAIGQPFYDASGAPLRFDGITVDVTGRIEQEEALREADRRKDEFLATLAHELRNPLAPIRNALRLMRRPGGDGELEAERAMAERQVAHLARLIDDLMDVARISKGKLELHREVVDLHTVVRQAVETARTQIDDRRHRLSVSLPEGPIRLEADPTRLEQVFWNLLNNASKYTEPGGRIALTAEALDGHVVVRVRDTGIGIAPEMLPRLFQMFVQVGEHRHHAQGGLGIGLGLVRTLVEMHGGTISGHSEGPGAGSEFVVRLPVPSGVPAAHAQQPIPPTGSGGGLPRRRILVVDDNADAANSLARLLERLYGQEVRVAHDGPEALAIAGEFRPEVVLLDIGLPGMDGHEVARRLRGRPETERALIAALTGWGLEADRRRSAEAGFDLHLVKPVDPDALRELLGGPHAGSP